MRLLVLGGTEFVGRAFVEDGVARGWQVDVLNRGTHPVPDGARALRGDRSSPGGLAALDGGEWDLVVDTWSWAPSAVRDAARALADRAGRYVYVSSSSVYTFPRAAGGDESAEVVPGSPDDTEVADYARAKIGGELAAVEAFDDRALLLRAGLILGPYENIGRLPWWLARIARGGTVPAPGPKDLGLQLIDGRDLARWGLDAAREGLDGPYDTVSPPAFTTMGELLEACVEVTGSGAELRWIDPERVEAAGVEPWVGLPIWLPPGETHGAMHQASAAKARDAGLVCRPVRETVADTWTWLEGIGGTAPRRPDRPVVGISAAEESRLLAER